MLQSMTEAETDIDAFVFDWSVFVPHLSLICLVSPVGYASQLWNTRVPSLIFSRTG